MKELLAPVGSKEALIAAVESGADAVYLAGKSFGARAYAANFDEEELADAIVFAHRRGVLVDVAVNTLVDDREFEELAQYLRFLYTAGADAIIVQDLGVAKLAKSVAPDLPLHASTQMTVHNIEGVRLLERLGFARVVLARELSLAEIKEICREARAEIEVFIHGALCICYSGQCLMSGMIGGRSGNRGRCAQPCRLPYTLVDETGRDLLAGKDAGEYLLSPRDINTLDILPELMAAGVTSFKIEGRMKRPEYVAVAVDIYRRRMDASLSMQKTLAAAEGDQKDLAQIFNRDFTTAYLKSRPGRRMMSDRRPNNRGVLAGRVTRYDFQKKLAAVRLNEPLAVGDTVEFWVKVGGRVNVTITSLFIDGREVSLAAANQEVSFVIPSPVKDHDRVFKVFDARLMARARSFFQAGAPLRRFAVDVRVFAAAGAPLRIEMTDEDGFYGEAETSFIAQAALKRPLTEESVRRQIERLGATVFSLRALDCRLKGDVMVPVSEVNEARRRAVEMLEEARLARFQRPPLKDALAAVFSDIQTPPRKKGCKPEICVSVDSLEKAAAALDAGADALLFGGESFSHRHIAAEEYQAVCELAKSKGKKIVFATPRIVKSWQMKSQRELIAAASARFCPDAFSVHTVGMLEAARAVTDAPLYADVSMNVYNRLSIEFLRGLGVAQVALSPELNFAQVEHLAAVSALPVACLVHGNLELMISEYCAMGSFLGGLDKGKCTQPCARGAYALLDRKNEKFPLVTDQYCRMHVLNGKELSMAPHIVRFMEAGVQSLRIEGKYMQMAAIKKWTRMYRELVDVGADHPLLRESAESMDHEQITRGHYFRGVL